MIERGEMWVVLILNNAILGFIGLAAFRVKLEKRLTRIETLLDVILKKIK